MTLAKPDGGAVTLRYGTEADAEAIAAMIGGLVAEFSGAPPDPHPEADAGVLACARRMLALRGAFWALVAEAGDAPVGVLMVHERASLRAADIHGKISELYIRPDRRGRGLGRTLIAAAAALGAERGWSRIEVGRPTTVDSASAHAVFARSGFAPVDGVLTRPL